MRFCKINAAVLIAVMLLGMCCPTQSVYAAGKEEGLKTESDTTGMDTDGTGTTSEESADKGASGEGTTMEDGADPTQSESSAGQDAEENAGSLRMAAAMRMPGMRMLN